MDTGHWHRHGETQILKVKKCRGNIREHDIYSFDSRLGYILRDLEILKGKSKVERENISSNNKKTMSISFQFTIYLQKKIHSVKVSWNVGNV